jgi:hypothetical protein
MARLDIRPGMTVVRADGSPFGKVSAVQSEGFVVKKPVGFDEDRFVKFELVGTFQGDVLQLSHGADLCTDPYEEGKDEAKKIAAAAAHPTDSHA